MMFLFIMMIKNGTLQPLKSLKNTNNSSSFPIPSKDTGPSLLGSMSLSSSSPLPTSYSEAKTASSGSLLNGPLSYSQSSDVIKVTTHKHASITQSVVQADLSS